MTLTLVRHGETAWSLSGQHTGKTDIPLTKQGENQAHHLKERLKGRHYKKVFTSPLQRALQTCELAGFSKDVEIDPDLAEWDYGSYEGLTRDEIWKMDPNWNIFLQGAPGGESIEDTLARGERFLSRLGEFEGDILLFSHGHFLRVLATLWLSLPLSTARVLSLSPASISLLRREKSVPAIFLWNSV
ncbi:MAG: histidine phosphatase family protein [Verrucomicrobia bacterium]|nr:histidine phosphatase family protein [Verrucomicrobiota bacterium]